MPMAPHADEWMLPGDIEHVRALYKASATETDDLVGRVLTTLDETGLAEDTLVIALSDHGMPLGEHNLVRKFGYPLYEESARIVWLMRKPGLIDSGSRNDSLVSNVDFVPTLLELAGVGHEFGLDGYSLAPVLRGDEEKVREALFMGAFNYRTGVRTEQHKLIDNRGEKPDELYDMVADPAETRNLLPEMPELGAKLHRDIWDFHEPWKAKRSRHHVR
jgi:arylsulfatase A-like enzyme